MLQIIGKLFNNYKNISYMLHYILSVTILFSRILSVVLTYFLNTDVFLNLKVTMKYTINLHRTYSIKLAITNDAIHNWKVLR